MDDGKIFTVTHGSFSQELIVIAVCKKKISGTDYNVHYVYDQENREYALYEKEGYTVGNPLDVTGHLIVDEKEIKGGDYYLKVHECKGNNKEPSSLDICYARQSGNLECDMSDFVIV